MTTRAKHSAGLSLVRFLVETSAWKLIGLGTAIYIATAIVFAVLYAACKGIQPDDPTYHLKLYDYLYFAFVTQTTIGYGDFSPVGLGKIVFVFHALFAITLFTTLLGAVATKLFLPSASGLHVSRFVVFYPDLEKFRIYLFNRHTLPIDDVEFALRLRSPSRPESLILDQNDVKLTRVSAPRLSQNIVWLIDTVAKKCGEPTASPSGCVLQRPVVLTPADAGKSNHLVFQTRGTYAYTRHIKTVEFDSSRIRCGRFVIVQRKHGDIDWDKVDTYERCTKDICVSCTFRRTCVIGDKWPGAQQSISADGEAVASEG